MTIHDHIRQQLLIIETLLRENHHWQMQAPGAAAFASQQPFCLDSMQPCEWLQWVLIPRLRALLDSGQPLPRAFSIAPYYEMALEASHPIRDLLLKELRALDALCERR